MRDNFLGFFSENESTNANEILHKSGFDNPLTNPDDDQLNRKRFINQIYPYLTNLKPEWSVRVGLLAPWGEGKTTVCRWIAKQAEKDGHIPVWFCPWSARTDAQLWVGFYTALTKALKDYDATYKTSIFSPKTIKHMVSSLTNKDWVEDISRLHQIGESGMRVVQSLTKMNAQDVQRLYESIKGKRFIVILDDLDRVDPSLIPRLLMTLRDVLDSEGFSFLLPFDHKIVSDALADFNKTSGFGENFLEKILDFRVHLDEATSDQVSTFFKREMQLNCPFISADTLEGLDFHLPTNPRRLKALVRGMRVFEAEAARHRQGEIDWKALIFAEMIKLESELFLDLYAKDTFEDKTDDNSGSHPWISAAIEKDKAKARIEEEERIKGLLEKAGVKLEEKRERLIQLCEGWRESYGIYGQHKIMYDLKLLKQPETLTWAEFDSFWKLWSKNNNFSELSQWFEHHAKQAQKPKDEIVQEVLITLAQQYDLHLEKAGSVALRSDQEAYVEKAKEILILYNSFIDQDIPNAPHATILTVEVFKKLIGAIGKWFHFRGNESDRNLREEEEVLLKKWVQKTRNLGLDQDYQSCLTKLKNDHFGEEGNLARLYRELSEIVGAGMDQAVGMVLKKEEGISKIFPDGIGEGIKKALLNADSSVWTPRGNSPAEQILSTAVTDSAVQINARDLLDLLRRASNLGTWDLRPEEVCEFYEHPTLIVAIWNAAIATELQYRRLKETRQVREFLISKGIPADQLAIPEWLMVGSETEQASEPPTEAV